MVIYKCQDQMYINGYGKLTRNLKANSTWRCLYIGTEVIGDYGLQSQGRRERDRIRIRTGTRDKSV